MSSTSSATPSSSFSSASSCGAVEVSSRPSSETVSEVPALVYATVMIFFSFRGPSVVQKIRELPEFLPYHHYFILFQLAHRGAEQL